MPAITPLRRLLPHPLTLLVGLSLAAGVPQVHAADEARADDQAGDAERVQLAQARRKAEEGRQALIKYQQSGNRNNQALVDAALAFKEAHLLFERAHDSEALCEAQANLFWCKKQMNLATVQEYLQQKGEETRQAVAQAEKVAERTVDPSEAQAYFQRAERFAADNPKDPMAISIRWFEVAERFAGTEIAVKAQRLSLAAQEAGMKAFQAAVQASRETRFTRPRPVVEGRQAPIPDAAAVKSGIAELRKAYAKAYARSTPADKRRLSHRLLEDAPKNRADAGTYYAMLTEAARLGQEGDDVEMVLDACETLGDCFSGYDVAAEKRTLLLRMPNRGVASAVVALIGDARNPGANTTVGRFFCVDLRRWDQGLPMLANGNDADLAKVAGLELDKPVDAPEFIATGDAWYALGKRPGRTEERNAFLARAQMWYNKGIGALDGVAKQRIEQRQAEIDKALPLDLDAIDWDSLSPGQWDKLKGQLVVVQARLDRTDPTITLKAGERLRMVPHPTDTWTFSGNGGSDLTTGWRGDGNPTGRHRHGFWSFELRRSDLNAGALLCWLDNTNPGLPPAIIQGPGRLFLCPNKGAGTGLATGSIRVKLLTLRDD